MREALVRFEERSFVTAFLRMTILDGWSGGAAGGGDEIAQRGNVRAVGANAAGVHGQTQLLGNIDIDARVVQLGQAETRGGLDAVQSSRIHGPRRP